MEGKYFKNTVLIADKSEQFREPSEIMLGARLGNASSIRRQLNVVAPTNGAAGTLSVNESFPIGNVESVPSWQLTASFALTGTTGLTAEGIDQLYGVLGVKREALSDLQTNATVELNGKQFNSRPQDIREVLTNTTPLSHLAKLSDAPAGQLFDSYDSGNINNSLREGANAIDTVSSNGIGNNWKISNMINVAADSFTFDIVYEEVVKANPFQYNDPNPRPFRNLSTFKMDIDTLDLSNGFIAVNTANTQAGTTLACTDAKWKLLIHTWNPSLSAKIPKQIVYNAPQIVRVKSQTVSLNAVPSVVTMDSVLVNTVPSAFFLFAKANSPTDGTKYGSPDQYAEIQNLASDAVNKIGVFQEYTSHQLYAMAIKNGYNERYSKWAMQDMGVSKLGTGSFMIIKPDDFPSSDQQSFISHSNVSQGMTFRIKLKGRTTAPATEAYTLHLFAMYDDLVLYNEADEGLYSSERPIISPTKLASSNVVYEDNKSQNNHIVGGSWASSLWNGLQYMKNLLTSPQARMISKSVRNSGAVPWAADGSVVGTVANAVGYGKDKKKAPKKKAMKKKGGEIFDIGKGKGGQRVSPAQLKKMLDSAY